MIRRSGAKNLNDGHKYGGRASLLFAPTAICRCA